MSNPTCRLALAMAMISEAVLTFAEIILKYFSEAEEAPLFAISKESKKLALNF